MNKARAYFLILSLLATVATVQAADIEGQYLRVYRDIQAADRLMGQGDTGNAQAKYAQALTSLQEIQQMYPDWSPAVVEFRLGYVNRKLQSLGAVSLIEPDGSADPTEPLLTPQEEQVAAEVARLQEQLRQLYDEKADLAAKLKEALAARPAALEPEAAAQIQAELEKQLAVNEQLQTELQAAKMQLEAQAVETIVQPDSNDTTDSEATALTIRTLEAALAKTEQERQQIEKEKQELQREIERRKQEEVGRAALAERNGQTQPRTPAATAQPETTEPGSDQELAVLKAKLEVLEAVRAPYKPEELLLFKVPAIPPSGKQPSTFAEKSPGLSSKAAGLVLEAEEHMRSRRFEQAKQKYAEVVSMREGGANVCASLALVEVQLGDLPGAEQTVNQGLALDPTNAYSLFVLGQIRMNQQRPNEALAALSRSAALDPSSPDVYNLLGIVLSDLGLRDAAETAFRRAIQLFPAYAEAHSNLVIVYATQVPPSPELARWHYDRARDLNYPRSPQLEALIDEAEAKLKESQANADEETVTALDTDNNL